MVSAETGTLFLHPDRNLAMELVRATEAAAIRSAPFIGKGDKNAADKAAVDAMRKFLGTVNFSGLVVIGEGEKDNAPMLYNGEVVGNGQGPACDIAVDPIDGTSLTAAGRGHAISMIAVADRGSMLDASSVFYMEKLVAGWEGIGVLDIRQSIAENIRALAAVKKKPVNEMRVAVLDRPGTRGSSLRFGRRALARAFCSTATWPAASTRPGTTHALTCASAQAAAPRVWPRRAR